MPDRFSRKWLAYDESRASPKRLARRFVMAVAAMLIVAAALALLTIR